MNDEPLIVSLADVERPREPVTGQTWGLWRYSKPLQTLTYTGKAAGWPYWIDLAKIHNVGDVGDWLMHMANKDWVTTTDLGYLARALHDCKDFWTY